jgi:hypothetical protein
MSTRRINVPSQVNITYVIDLLNAKANVSDLTTANVVELTNLYYSNARVYSNVITLLPTLAGSGISIAANGQISSTAAGSYGNANVAAYLTTYTGNVNAGNIIANTIIGRSGGSITGANLISTNIISSSIWTGLYAANVVGLTTANVSELTNLYYTNARVYSNVIGLIGTKANVSDLTTANVNEFGSNLYYTNARVYSNVATLLSTYTGNVNAGNIVANTIIGQGGGYITGANLISTNIISSSIWTGLYAANVVGLNTANVSELTNLYYTNARVYSNTIALLPTLAGSGISIAANGQISSTAAGSYGNANVAAYLTTYTGNVNAGNIIANTIIGSGSGGGYITGANLISTNIISSSIWTGLYASNVVGLTTANVTELTNLYYTNTRVYSNTIALLPTLAGSGIAIAANGQISSTAAGSYGNANVAAYLTTYTGNVNAGNIIANTIIGSGSGGGYITGANLISTNIISATTWTGLYASNVVGLTTANVSELTNLYYTNTRVYSNTIALLQTLAGNNIIIAANGQISANLASVGGGSASSVLANGVIGLNTANVNEFGSNLYYTNARVYSNVIAALPTYTGNISAGNVIANAIIGRTGGFISGANLISTNIISSSIWTGLYASNVVGLTTANVAEVGNNIFYTNARVYSNVITLLPTLAGSGISIAANGQITSTAAGSYANANVAAYLPTYTGNISAGNLIVTGGIIDTTGVLSITTLGGTNANIELVANGSGRIILDGMAWPLNDGANGYSLQTNGTGNLFWGASAAGFSNADIAAYLPNYTGNVSAGNVIANAIIGRTGGFISGANLISTNIISSSIWTGLYASNVVGLTTANVTELTNLYYTNARVYSNVIGLLNAKANVSDLTTSNVTELTNLYYTNARVYANVINLLNIKANITDITTANVTEITNLYYTNNRVFSNVSALLSTYTGNVNAGNVIANTIIGRSGGSITGANLISTNIISSSIWTGLYASNVVGLTTANVTELTNLYYTNARVYSNVIGLINSKANVSDITTANVNEFGSNLYYTNARVYSNVIGLLNAKANVSDLTTSNVTELTNLYYTNARVYSNVIGLLNAKANVSDLTTANVAEVGNNTFYTNARVDARVQNLTVNVNTSANIIANTFIMRGTGNASLVSSTDFTLQATGNLNLLGANVVTANLLFIGQNSGAVTATNDFSISATGNINLNSSNIITTSNTLTLQGSGVPTLFSDSVLSINATTGVYITASPLRLASMTTTQRNTFTAANGDLIYNITTNKFQGYENGAWVNLI